MIRIGQKSINDWHWQMIMLQAIRSLYSRNMLSVTECGRLASSVAAPMKKEKMPPFDLFLNYREYWLFLEK